MYLSRPSGDGQSGTQVFGLQLLNPCYVYNSEFLLLSGQEVPLDTFVEDFLKPVSDSLVGHLAASLKGVDVGKPGLASFIRMSVPPAEEE